MFLNKSLFSAILWGSVLSTALTAVALGATPAPTLKSPRAVVVDATTGEVLLAKSADKVASLASITKLMTAMVVLDAKLNAQDTITIDEQDLDTLKGTVSGVPVGASFTRQDLLRLALLASDNHAAAALARTFPGGKPAFKTAVRRKVQAMGLLHTELEEPTGLSPNNRSTARDISKVVAAASNYPEITDITSQASASFDVNGLPHEFRNTNKLVGSDGWNILVSKTGYTREAGVCVSMLIEAAGRKAFVVLMGANNGATRALDALNIRRWLSGEALSAQTAPLRVTSTKTLKPLKGTNKPRKPKKKASRRR